MLETLAVLALQSRTNGDGYEVLVEVEWTKARRASS
jgi:hypothetical protein